VPDTARSSISCDVYFLTLLQTPKLCNELAAAAGFNPSRADIENTLRIRYCKQDPVGQNKVAVFGKTESVSVCGLKSSFVYSAVRAFETTNT
jgi:hypothetical protein